MENFMIIPKPFKEDWHQMTPTEKGRHCAKCNLEVQDFSKMSNEKIFEILSNATKRVCGRFHENQMDLEPSLTDKLKQFLYAFAIVFLAFVPLESYGQVPNAPKSETALKTGGIEGKIVNENNETIPFAYVGVYQYGVLKGQSKTSFNGEFKIEQLFVGSYTLKVSSVGYRKFSIKEVIVTQNQIIHLDTINIKKKTIMLEPLIITSRRSRHYGGACPIIEKDTKSERGFNLIDPNHPDRQIISGDQIRGISGGHRD